MDKLSGYPEQQQKQQPQQTTANLEQQNQRHAKPAAPGLCNCDPAPLVASASLIAQAGSAMNESSQQQQQARLEQAGQNMCPSCSGARPPAAGQRTPGGSVRAKQLQQLAKQFAPGHQHPAPIRLFVEPRSDDSVRCDCRNCQFFSGWCCMPFALLIVILVFMVWICTKEGLGQQANQPATTTPGSQTTSTTRSPTSTTDEDDFMRHAGDAASRHHRPRSKLDPFGNIF